MSAYCVDCNVKAAPERGPGTPLVIHHSVDCPNVTSKAPSSPVETTDAPERPLAPEALNGLTGAAYTDVIRREGPTDYLRGYRDGLNAVLDAIMRDPLFEATNVPDHNDPEFGFDKTAALSERAERIYRDPMDDGPPTPFSIALDTWRDHLREIGYSTPDITIMLIGFGAGWEAKP